MARRRGIGKRWLLKGVRRGVLSPLSFTDNRDVESFDRACLGRATDIVEERRGNVS